MRNNQTCDTTAGTKSTSIMSDCGLFHDDELSEESDYGDLFEDDKSEDTSDRKRSRDPGAAKKPVVLPQRDVKKRKKSPYWIAVERRRVLEKINYGQWRWDAFYNCSKEWNAYLDASEEVRADFDVALAAVEKLGSYNLFYASKELRDNLEIVMAAVHQKGDSLRNASSRLQGNFDVVMAAVQQDGIALQYASCELCANPAIVEAAVRQNGYALQYASEDLHADKRLVLTAVRRPNSTEAFKFAAASLQKDYDFIARAVIVARAITTSIWRGGIRGILYYIDVSIQREIIKVARRFATLGQARIFVNEGRQSQAAFMEFLFGVKSKKHVANVEVNKEKPVTSLNFDKETSEKLHRHIAEYAGVPLGQELKTIWLVEKVMPILEAACDNDHDLPDRIRKCGIIHDLRWWPRYRN